MTGDYLDQAAATECPWKTGSKRKRFYRPDWAGSPDCPGCADGCGGSLGDCQAHQCHVHGMIGACLWPKAILMDNHHTAYWFPSREAGLAERWL